MRATPASSDNSFARAEPVEWSVRYSTIPVRPERGYRSPAHDFGHAVCNEEESVQLGICSSVFIGVNLRLSPFLREEISSKRNLSTGALVPLKLKFKTDEGGVAEKLHKAVRRVLFAQRPPAFRIRSSQNRDGRRQKRTR